MKYSLFIAAVTLLLFSCESPKPKNEVLQIAKYSVKSYQNSKNSYDIVYCNVLNGDVFVLNENNTAFKVSNPDKLKKYDYPSYSIEVLKSNLDNYVLILTDMNSKKTYRYDNGVTAGFFLISDKLEGLK